MHNWAGNITYSAAEYLTPTSVEQLQEIVSSAPRIHAVGTGHSFNRIADTDGVLVSTFGLTSNVSVDEQARTARVPAAARYAQVAAELEAAGWALHNLGSLPHISVAGACATGTHGSGIRNQSLVNAVRAVELVRADGELVRVDESDPAFSGVVLSLGALGVVTNLDLAIEPSYEMRQDVYLDVPLAEAAAHTDEILGAAYSVSLFSNFRRPEVIDSVWLKAKIGADEEERPEQWFGGRLAETEQHPIPGLDPVAATPQLGSVGRWHERLPHFRIEFTPSNGEELQSEFFVPREMAGSVLEALRGAAGEFAGALQVFEMRTIASDDLWLSPCHGRESVGVHLTWLPDIGIVAPALRAVQRLVAPFDARPHWAKVFLDVSRSDIEKIYPRLDDFRELAAVHDPDGRFRNDFLTEYVL